MLHDHTDVAGLPTKQARLSVREREEAGRAARKTAPRTAQADTGVTRKRHVSEIINLQNESRVTPLIPLRYERMSASAFTFFRGTAAVQAGDLGAGPSSGLTVQLCGDAHLANFGLFAARDRQTVFDLNDFDETSPGPFEWDLKRLAASIALAAREAGADPYTQGMLAGAAANSYSESMRAFSLMPDINLWYYRVDEAKIGDWTRGLSKEVRAIVTKGLTAAEKRTNWTAISKFTETVDGKRRFRNNPPVLTRMPEGHANFLQLLYSRYLDSLPEDRRLLVSRYTVVDAAFKVVGVGSVGLFAVAVLLQGRDDNDLLALQLKQAQASVLEEYTKPSPFDNHGRRVVVGQTLIQAASDSLLGWLSGLEDREYYVRQLRDKKWSPDLGKLPIEGLVHYSKACATTLARAHARTGDPVAISAYMGKSGIFEDAISKYAVAYTGRVDQDYEDFLELVRGYKPPTDETLAEWWERVLHRNEPLAAS